MEEGFPLYFRSKQFSHNFTFFGAPKWKPGRVNIGSIEAVIAALFWDKLPPHLKLKGPRNESGLAYPRRVPQSQPPSNRFLHTSEALLIRSHGRRRDLLKACF